MTEWFVMKDGEKQGPITSEQLTERAGAGSILPTDTISRDGLGDWMPASKVSGLEFTPPMTTLADVDQAPIDLAAVDQAPQRSTPVITHEDPAASDGLGAVKKALFFSMLLTYIIYVASFGSAFAAGQLMGGSLIPLLLLAIFARNFPQFMVDNVKDAGIRFVLCLLVGVGTALLMIQIVITILSAQAR